MGYFTSIFLWNLVCICTYWTQLECSVVEWPPCRTAQGLSFRHSGRKARKPVPVPSLPHTTQNGTCTTLTLSLTTGQLQCPGTARSWSTPEQQRTQAVRFKSNSHGTEKPYRRPGDRGSRGVFCGYRRGDPQPRLLPPSTPHLLQASVSTQVNWAGKTLSSTRPPPRKRLAYPKRYSKCVRTTLQCDLMARFRPVV